MIPEFVRGPIAPVFSIFEQDGTFDPDGQRRFFDFLLLSGTISAFFVRSGMGQMYAYEYDDVKLMADTACSHLKGKANVLVGTTGIWDRNYEQRPDPKVFTQQAVELSQYAEQAGANGVVHTLPEAILPQGNETYADVILRYFETINDAVSCPIFIYQPPGTAAEYILRSPLVEKLADLPNVKGMKASTPDAMYILDICHAVKGKDFGYIVGHEGAFYAGLHSGAKAVIGQGSTLNPQILLAVQDRFDAGDMEGAQEAQYSVNYLCQAVGNPVEFYKRYATSKGYPVHTYERAMRNLYGMPRPPMSQEEFQRSSAILEAELAKYTATSVA